MTFLNDLLSFNVASLAGLVLIPGLAILLISDYYIFLGVYNLFFHPLAKFPGPKLYGFSRIPWSFAVIGGKSCFKLSDLHDKYGDVVRIGPNELSYTNSQIWKEVYGSQKPGQGQMQKDPLHYQKHDKTPSLHVSNDADHTRMRKLISHAFSDKALRDQEPLMQSYTDSFVQRMGERAKSGESINIRQWYYWLLFDVFGDLCFGESFGCLREQKSHPWIDIISEATQAFAYIGLSRRVPGLERLLMSVIPKKKTEQAAWHTKFSSDMADKRLAMVTDRPDFMSFILRYNDEKGLSVPELRSNSNSLVAGGSDTTGTFLSGTTWFLLKNPTTYKKLVDEIRSSFNSEEDITIANLSHLKYLNAVIQEGLRVYPPVPSSMPRSIPDGGAMVCGRWLPGGTSVCVAPYAMFMSSANFVDPKSFIPERWLGDPKFDTDDKHAFQPFSYGPRGCIGKNLAYAEMRLVLAKFLWNFDLELQPESENWFPHEMIIVWSGPPLHVKVKPAVKKGSLSSI